MEKLIALFIQILVIECVFTTLTLCMSSNHNGQNCNDIHVRECKRTENCKLTEIIGRRGWCKKACPNSRRSCTSIYCKCVSSIPSTTYSSSTRLDVETTSIIPESTTRVTASSTLISNCYDKKKGCNLADCSQYISKALCLKTCNSCHRGNETLRQYSTSNDIRKISKRNEQKLKEESKDSSSLFVWLIVAIMIVVSLIIAIFVGICVYKKRRKRYWKVNS